MKTKTDKELLRIWDNQDNSNKDFWIYQRLTNDEKIKLFDLLEYREPNPIEIMDSLMEWRDKK